MSGTIHGLDGSHPTGAKSGSGFHRRLGAGPLLKFSVHSYHFAEVSLALDTMRQVVSHRSLGGFGQQATSQQTDVLTMSATGIQSPSHIHVSRRHSERFTLFFMRRSFSSA